MILPLLKYKTKFEIDYPSENIDYYSKHEKAKELFNKLLASSNNYCMYCGGNLNNLTASFKSFNKLKIYFEREHTIEKEIENGVISSKLKKCKFNFGVSCRSCNSTKKIGVKLQNKNLVKKFEEKICPALCSFPCDEYLELLKDYIETNHILGMPRGYLNEYDIIYNTNKFIFEINSENIYTSKEKTIINNHIQKFLSIFEKDCIVSLLTYFENSKNYETLPKKKNLDNTNHFEASIVNELIDYLEERNFLQRKLIISTLIKKYKRSNGIEL